MKKIRVLFSIMALVLGVSASFATKVTSNSAVQYEFIPRVGLPDECKMLDTQVCNNLANIPCTINGHKVGDSQIASTACGQQQTRN